MPAYRVVAQACVGTRRIVKVIAAESADTAVRFVTDELDRAGFYIVDVVRVN